MRKKLCYSAILLFVFVSFPLLPNAWANVKQIKAYKEAFPEEKPKCIHCHVSEKPKKEAGEHELNDYGKKVKQLREEPDTETYKAAGK